MIGPAGHSPPFHLSASPGGPFSLLSHDPVLGVVVSSLCDRGPADIVYLYIYSDLGGRENPLRRYHSRPWAGKSGIGGRTNPVKLDVKRSTLASEFPGLSASVAAAPSFLLAFPLDVSRGHARKI